MKKWVAILMALLLMTNLLTAASAAGDFELRQGIRFGDTMETILLKEKVLVRESDTSNWFNGRIAGYDDAQCGFYFDDDGRLTGLDYSFKKATCETRSDTTAVYETIYDSLVRQYGTPIGNTGGSIELITGPAIDRMLLWVYLLGALDGFDADYIDYDEWVVDCDGYHVKIDLISYYYRDSSYEYSYFVDVSYHRYTDADYEAAVNEKRQERQEVDDDL